MKAAASILAVAAIFCLVSTMDFTEAKRTEAPHFDYGQAECRAPTQGEIRGTFEWVDTTGTHKRCSVLPIEPDKPRSQIDKKLQKNALRSM